jgi:hypothetical protein
MADILQLAEYCEQATGPDWKLDAAIALATNWQDCIPCDFNGIKHRMGGILNAPHFTASLDAAMTLVPDGYIWAATNMDPETGLVTRAASMVSPNPDADADADADPAIAATPALALCAAALRARAATWPLPNSRLSGK